MRCLILILSESFEEAHKKHNKSCFSLGVRQVLNFLKGVRVLRYAIFQNRTEIIPHSEEFMENSNYFDCQKSPATLNGPKFTKNDCEKVFVRNSNCLENCHLEHVRPTFALCYAIVLLVGKVSSYFCLNRWKTFM